MLRAHLLLLILATVAAGCGGGDATPCTDCPDGGAGSGPDLLVDHCPGVTCGATKVCDPATGDCICPPGTISGAKAMCVAAAADDPSMRAQQPVCDRWLAGHVVTDPHPFTASSLDACDPGTLSAAGQNDALVRLNAYRWLCGLNDNITLNPALQAQEQACAVGVRAQGMLSHQWPMDWKCYTQPGADAAASSNESQLDRAPPAASIDQYFIESGANNYGVLGHRRWCLYPPLGPVAIGAVDDKRSMTWTCLYVFDKSGSGKATWTSYPNRGYTPLATTVMPGGTGIWSFHSRTIKVDENSKVTVKRVGDNTLLDIDVVPCTSGYADMWAISWVPNGWTPEIDQTYRVDIDNGNVIYDVKPFDCQ